VSSDLLAGDGTEEIVYRESVRAITEQEAALDGLRARTGTLLAAASLTTGFIGAQALGRHPTLAWDGWIAIAGFLGTAGFCLMILWPWTWEFIVSARILIEDHVQVPERNSRVSLHLFLAATLEENWERNERKLGRLNWCFRGATLFLAADVLVWLLVLGR
jgi:hypothetical protein